MSPQSRYKTKQRELLLDYLAAVPGRHFTAGDVCEYFREQGAPIGQSTVYRQLERLVDEGITQKYSVGGGSAACFEYMSADSHENTEFCFHCKCEKCGRLIHLRCEELEEIQTHLYEDHGFRMNPTRTVFYGLCDQCT